MFLIFGFRTKSHALGPVRMTCPVCRQSGDLLLAKDVTRLSLFFVPLLPVRTKHVAYCVNPFCGARVDVRAAEAPLLLAAAGVGIR